MIHYPDISIKRGIIKVDEQHKRDPRGNCDPYKSLWGGVLLQAAKDLIEARKHKDTREEYHILTWVNEENGQFDWICENLDLDKQLIKTEMNNPKFKMLTNLTKTDSKYLKSL